MTKPGTAHTQFRVGAKGSGASFAWSNVRPEVLAAISILLGAVGQLILKGGLRLLAANAGDPDAYARIAEPITIALLGLAVYAIGTWFWVKAVSRAVISYLYPMSALSYGVVALGGRFFFHESIQTGRWIGIAIITIGVAMLTVSNLRGIE